MLQVGGVTGVEQLGERPRPGDRLQPFDPLLVGHAFRLETSDLGRPGCVLLGVEHLAGILEHRLDHADHVDHVGGVLAVQRRDHLDGERHERRREPQRAALVLSLHQRADAHADASAALVAAALGHACCLEAAVDGDRPALVLPPARRAVVVGAEEVLQRVRAVRTGQHAGHEVRRDLEPRHERFGRRGHEALHRGLVVVDEAVRRLRLDRLAPGLRVVTGAGQRPGVLDDVIGSLHPHVTVGVEARSPCAPGQLMELAGGELAHPGAVVLRERGHEHGADRDVHADAERVRAADDRQEALGGQSLHQTSVPRQHACVVDAHAVAHQTVERGAEAATHPLAGHGGGDRLALRTVRHVQVDQCLGPLDGRRLVGVDDVHRAESVADRFADALGDRRGAPLVVERCRPVHRGHLGHRPARALRQVRDDRAHVTERRRGQQHLAPGQLEQRNLPGPPSLAVAVVVELVQAGEAEVTAGAREQGVVGEHLGRAHEHGRVDVDRRVAGRQANLLGSQQVGQVEELLGHQGLDRRGPDRSSPVVAGQQHAGHGDQALARPRRCGQDHVLVGGQGERSVLLVRVERPAALGRPRPERLQHGQRIGADRREEIGEDGHGTPVCRPDG